MPPNYFTNNRPPITRFDVNTAPLPYMAANCGIVGSVFASAQDCDTFRHYDIVQAEGQCYGDFIIWDPTATGPNETAGTGTQGDWIVLSEQVALCCKAGLTGQQLQAIAIGVEAGNYNQSSGAIALGLLSGNTEQGLSSIAIGVEAGKLIQQDESIAIGYQAGYDNQAIQSVAIGFQAGFSEQHEASIAIGTQAGLEQQQVRAVAIGYQVGYSQQGAGSVAIGYQAGLVKQHASSIAIGYQSGLTAQQEVSVAIGSLAGSVVQGTGSVAVGQYAGSSNQGQIAVAIGSLAGGQSQGFASVAVGSNAGNLGQGNDSVAIGSQCASVNQSAYSVAIGNYAGHANQGSLSVAIGYAAGITNQHQNSIVINAQNGTPLNTTNSGLFVAPIAENTGPKALIYEPSTKEVRFGDYLPPGVVLPFAGAAAPYGFLLCNGASYSTSLYPTLFALIGYTYGGAGANFNVPNMVGRVAVGRDAGQTEFDTLGETGGAKTVTLTVNEIPAHSHGVTDNGHTHTYLGVQSQGAASGLDNVAENSPRPTETTSLSVTGISIQNTGGGLPHNNLQPYLVLNHIIKF